jgi:hypothetical protein
MERLEEQGIGGRDEGMLAVSLLVLGCAGIVVPRLAWALVGLSLLLLGALVTVALWQRYALRHEAPSRSARLAVWMLKFSAPWTILGRALVGWLSG